MWWSWITWGVAFMLSFALGYVLCEVVQAMRRPRSMPNPYLGDLPPWRDPDSEQRTSHEHTRPPGWHP